MRTIALALLVAGAAALAGCQGSGGQYARALPGDLPASPEPGQRYCKVWVPPQYRTVPKLVKASGPSMKTETITVLKTTANEVMVQGPEEHNVSQGAHTCNSTLVQTKPGGYHWEKDSAGCWQYKHRLPEYQWCDKTVQEDGVKFCYTTPPKYETVVETRPVQTCRQSYVPPKYEVRYEQELYKPGHWEWRSQKACGSMPTQDTRAWSSEQLVKERCVRPAPAAPALDCGCPRSN